MQNKLFTRKGISLMFSHQRSSSPSLVNNEITMFHLMISKAGTILPNKQYIGFGTALSTSGMVSEFI